MISALPTNQKVRNQSDAIKIAVDFITIDNLLITVGLENLFREQRLAEKAGDDVLQILTTLWYCWSSLSAPVFRIIEVDEDVSMADAEQNPLSINISGFELSDSESNPTASDATKAFMSSTRSRHTQRKNAAKKNGKKYGKGKRYDPRAGFDFVCPNNSCSRRSSREGLLDHM